MNEAVYAHVHGFNSSAASHTLRLVREHFPLAHGLEYPCSGLYADNMRLLRRQIDHLPRGADSPLVISGSSLGGFYASQLAAHYACPCVLFNPVVFPAEALHPFVGRNVHYYSGEAWDFTPAMLHSYADFADVRPLPLPRFVLLGSRDSVLNPAVARDYWQGHAELHYTDDEHSLTALDATTADALRRFGQRKTL